MFQLLVCLIQQHYVTMSMHPQIRTEYLSAAQVALVDTLVSGSVYQHYFESCDLVYRPICLQAIEIKQIKLNVIS